MKKLFTLLTLLLSVLGSAQTLTGKLVNPLKGMKGMDIAIWPLGLDRSITIGQLKTDGTLEFTFPPKESFLSDNEAQQMVANDLKYALYFNCLGQEEGLYPEIMAGDVVEATYDYQLELEAGLNFIAYSIEEIYETNPKVTSFKPSRVTVKNIREGLDGIQWFAKYL